MLEGLTCFVTMVERQKGTIKLNTAKMSDWAVTK